MPELPEVETIARGLNKRIVGKTIKSVDFDWPKSFPNSPADVKQFMLGSTVKKVSRRAKIIKIELDTLYTLIVHLKMTGQLVLIGSDRYGGGHPNDSLIKALPDRSTRVTITFDDKSNLYFNDQRKFGWMRLLPSVEIAEINFVKKLGPEPLSSSLKTKDFISRIRRRANSTIKAAILDQSVIAGIGNIYADESLWAARIHPETRVKDVSDSKLTKLLSEARTILRLAIDQGGSTDRNYVDSEGKKGNYLNYAKVFRRDGQACPRCSKPIKKIRVAGRGTHFCSHCQRRVKSKS